MLPFLFYYTFAISYVDSAERHSTSIKINAKKISQISRDFTTLPQAPTLFHVYKNLSDDIQTLERELRFTSQKTITSP